MSTLDQSNTQAESAREVVAPILEAEHLRQFFPVHGFNPFYAGVGA